MSRIGKQPVTWKSGTNVSFADGVLTVGAGKATLKQSIDGCIEVSIDDAARRASFAPRDASREARAMHGLYRALAANMVLGVEKGFERKLEIQGVGYSAKLEGKALVLQIGFNKPVKMPVPEGVSCEVPGPTNIVVRGADKQRVGQFAAEIRRVRPPEPYKGKGIRYEGEYVRRKVGKSLGA
jgi:large subunit ribosomal protein L6